MTEEEEITWSLEKRKLKELTAFHKNPRKITKVQGEHLKKSIDKFGLIDRPFINRDGIIIGGHQRINVMGMKPNDEIEVMVPSRLLDNSEVEELNVRHNANHGEFDQDILANEFELDDLVNWGLEELKVISETLMMVEEEPEDDKKKKKKEKLCPHCGLGI